MSGRIPVVREELLLDVITAYFVYYIFMEVLEAVHAVRNTLEGYARSCTRPGLFAGFPEGSCMDASYLLIKALRIYGHTNYVLVSARSGSKAINFSTHAWLEIGSHIIDITADQFNHRLGLDLPAVIHTVDKSWHYGEFRGHHVRNGTQLDNGVDKFANSPNIKPTYDRLLAELSAKAY